MAVEVVKGSGKRSAHSLLFLFNSYWRTASACGAIGWSVVIYLLRLGSVNGPQESLLRRADGLDGKFGSIEIRGTGVVEVGLLVVATQKRGAVAVDTGAGMRLGIVRCLCPIVRRQEIERHLDSTIAVDVPVRPGRERHGVTVGTVHLVSGQIYVSHGQVRAHTALVEPALPAQVLRR